MIGVDAPVLDTARQRIRDIVTVRQVSGSGLDQMLAWFELAPRALGEPDAAVRDDLLCGGFPYEGEP